MEKEPVFEKISEDARGANYRVLLPNGQELVLIYSRAGSKRGGHSHDAIEVSLVLTGRVKVTKHLSQLAEENSAEYSECEVPAGETYRNEIGDAHIGEFLADTWLVDWKLTAKAGEFSTVDYLPFRSAVLKQ